MDQHVDNVGKRIAEFLQRNRISHVFGVPGGQSYALYLGLEQTSGIDHVLMHDERSAGFAADGYARVTGRVGVCDATVGPGATNLPSAVGEAYTASVPMVGLVADIPRAWEHLRQRGNASQALRQMEMFTGMTKWQARLDDPSAVHDVLATAFRVMQSGRPGPVVITVPEDVFFASAEQDGSAVEAGGLLRTAPDPARVRHAADVLASSRRPVLVAGGGVLRSGAQEALHRLAERLGCPVATTISGKGSIAETHPLAVGVMGSMGRRVANEIVAEADCVVFVGSKVGQVATCGWEVPGRDVPVVHVDVDPLELGRVFSQTVPLVADAALGLTALEVALAGTERRAESGWDTSALRQRVDAWYAGAVGEPQPEGEPLRPQRVMHLLDQHMTDDDILVTDASLSGGWGSAYTTARTAGTVFLAGRGLAGLGWGLPAAIGAAVGRRSMGLRGRTVLVAGDGGFAYSVQELEVAKRLDLPIVSIVLNNSVLGWVKHTATARFGAEYGSIGTDFGSVDYAKVAEGFGVPSCRVESETALQAALKELDGATGPALVEVISDEWETPVLKLANASPDTPLLGEGL